MIRACPDGFEAAESHASVTSVTAKRSACTYRAARYWCTGLKFSFLLPRVQFSQHRKPSASRPENHEDRKFRLGLNCSPTLVHQRAYPKISLGLPVFAASRLCTIVCQLNNSAALKMTSQKRQRSRGTVFCNSTVELISRFIIGGRYAPVVPVQGLVLSSFVHPRE